MENIKKLLKQMVSFGIIGGIITLLSLLIYWVCVHFGIHYQVANAIGFVITVAISYVLNNCFTFSEGKGVKWSFVGLVKTYISYSITGILMASFLLWLWTEILEINENIGPLLNLFFTIPINFFLNKYWIYKKDDVI